MILDKKETTVAYRCSSCGMHVMSPVGIFALSGDMTRLKCACGGSELTATYTSDRRIRLTVPCVVCPHPHNYVLSSSLFFGRDILEFNCSLTGVEICFIGKNDCVLTAIKESDDRLIEMLGEADLDDFDFDRNGEDGEDEDVELEDGMRELQHPLW